MGNDRRWWWIPALGGGLLAGAALPPLGCPPLLWLALVPLWRAPLVLHPRPVASGFLWGLGAVLVSHRWLLWLHPLDWVGVPGPLSLPICMVLWLGCGLLAGALVGAWCALVARLGAERFDTALIGSLLWGLAETLLARGPLFWIGVGGSALPLDPALAGLAALGGSAWVAAAQLLLGWGLAQSLFGRGSLRRRWAAWAALALALHLAGFLALTARAQPRPSEPAPQSLRLLVLQPAIPTREKFLPFQRRRLLDLLAAAQREAVGRGADAVLLPEGALEVGVPLPLQAPVAVLGGGFRYAGEQLRSSLLGFPPGERLPDRWLDKHRLVPLGEWVPLAGWWRWAGLSAVGGVEPGAPSRLLPADGRIPGPGVAVAICYELSDGAALASAVRGGAGWLLASANLDPYPLLLQRQFEALARLRAIESGRWLISSANTGPSLLVDDQGRVRSRLGPGRARTGLMTLETRTTLTPYARWGEAPLALLLTGAVLLRWRRSTGGQSRGGSLGGTKVL